MFNRVLRFSEFLVDLGHYVVQLGPIKIDARDLLLRFLRADQRGQRIRQVSQKMRVASFLLMFDALPLTNDRTGIRRVTVAENMRMPPDQFFGNFPQYAIDIESAGFPGHLGVHNDVQQEVAEFFSKVFVVVVSNRSQQLVCFLDQLWQD